jgi:diguanylate cyclase (GGDEF)-like protein
MFHDRFGGITGAVIVFHDVSAARARSIQMTHSAHQEVITNLPDRQLLNDRITQTIFLAHRQNRPFAVLFLDLDHFKHINDSLGQTIGDQLLESVSKRLLSTVRGSDIVSRQGGDEFVILLSEIADPEDAATSAKKILPLLSVPHSIEGRQLDVAASIGISLYPAGGENADALIKNAETAMYHAKELGRNNFQFFKAEMNRNAVERQSPEGSRRGALDQSGFLLHYQPKVDLCTGQITGAEAWIRWQHPDRRLVSPVQFAPFAKDCGVTLPIGRWVLRTACRQAREWPDTGVPFKRVSINTSATEFHAKAFVEEDRATLRETGLERRYLDLGLQEGVLKENAESRGALLRELKKMGVHLAVNDFGTGYSSLSYLQQFPMEALRIDQSFVRQISSDPNNSAIARAIIDIAKDLKQRVIAEGIETQEQLTLLQPCHSGEGQGYLCSRPGPDAEFTHLVRIGITETAVE